MVVQHEKSLQVKLSQLQTLYPWASYHISLRLAFLICKMEERRKPTSIGCYEVWRLNEVMHKTLMRDLIHRKRSIHFFIIISKCDLAPLGMAGVLSLRCECWEKLFINERSCLERQNFFILVDLLMWNKTYACNTGSSSLGWGINVAWVSSYFLSFWFICFYAFSLVHTTSLLSTSETVVLNGDSTLESFGSFENLYTRTIYAVRSQDSGWGVGGKGRG